MFFSHNCSQLSLKEENQKVILSGWVKKIRQLGSLLFFDLQDNYGFIQIIVKNPNLINDLTKKVNRGYLLKVVGIVKSKLKANFSLKKDNLKENNNIEIELESYQIINPSKVLPFEIEDEVNINEDTKYRYRYLDLRRPNSKRLLVVKNQLLYELRKFFYEEKFIEVETPILAQSSPEGANCFLVVSNFKDRYYTLPQSPQIFKQLLMIGGFAKYYQIAKTFRNEDARSNRQVEFLQLDLEMSFTSSQEIINLVEKFLKYILQKTFDYSVKIPFSHLTYQQVIDKYGSDKPDLRANKNDKELSFYWITDWPLFEYNSQTKKYEALRHPFTAPKSEYLEPFLNNKIAPDQIIGEAFDLVCNGEELLSGGMRIYQRPLQEKVLETLGYKEEEREKHFGYFLQALDFAAPPHGGIGFGIDRLLAIILEVRSLKELIAFPKNIDGTCSLTGTPNLIDKDLK